MGFTCPAYPARIQLTKYIWAVHSETRKAAPGLRLVDKWAVVPLENGDVDVTMLKDAVELINAKFETEASGNVTIETVHKIGQSGVTFISSGALTHSVKALDISLKIDTELALEVGKKDKTSLEVKETAHRLPRIFTFFFPGK